MYKDYDCKSSYYKYVKTDIKAYKSYITELHN